MEPMSSSIDITVAAVVEQQGRFLVVEERVAGEVVFNQPAGHVEPDESVLAAVVRETIEETGHVLEPEFLVGIYRWTNSRDRRSYLRISIAGRVDPPREPARLDDGIIAAHWLDRAQLLSSTRKLRSPLVMRTIDDFLAGARYSLDCLTQIVEVPDSALRLG
jgi:8-oxo-dGTP pyrophosphatase MutT (NUDIX family)